MDQNPFRPTFKEKTKEQITANQGGDKGSSPSTEIAANRSMSDTKI